MAFRRSDPARQESPGIRHELRAFLAESSEHLQTRAELLRLEAREAAAFYTRRMVLAVAALLGLLLAYLLVLCAAVGCLGDLLAGSGFSLRNWMGGALLLALGHFVASFLALRASRQAGKQAEFFRATLTELRKDQEWLTREKNN